MFGLRLGILGATKTEASLKLGGSGAHDGRLGLRASRRRLFGRKGHDGRLGLTARGTSRSGFGLTARRGS